MKLKKSKIRSRKNLILISLVGLSLFHHFGFLSKLIEVSGHNQMRKEAISYINNSILEKGGMVALLEGAYAALSLAESSQGGISLGIEFEVQIGKTIVSIVEMVKNTRDSLLASIAILIGLELVLEFAPYLAAPIFDVFFFLMIGYAALSYLITSKTRLHYLLKGLMEILLVIGVLIYFVVPFSLWVSGGISHDFISDRSQLHKEGLKEVFGKVSLGEQAESKDRIKWAKSRLNELEGTDEGERSKTRSHMSRVVVYAFVETIVIPLMLTVIGHFLVRVIIQHFFKEMAELNLDSKAQKLRKELTTLKSEFSPEKTSG